MKKHILTYILIYIVIVSINVNFAEVSIVAPAVAKADYGYVGTSVDIDVRASNGSGHVYIDTLPMTELDMQSSARIAAKVAFDICNKNQKNYDVYYIVRSDIPIVGGPSAGGAICVATVAELNNWSINKDVMMTGMIYPDGGIGPVGGILEKIKAAKESGAKYFLIPYGERYIKVDHLGDENNTIDTIEYGKSLGIEVIEIKSIYDAIYYFTNYKVIENNHTSNPMVIKKYKDNTKDLADKVLSQANHNYDYMENRLYQERGNPYLNYNMELDLIKKLKTSKENIIGAEELYANKSYYAATSKAFSAMITLEEINTTLNYIECTDKKGFIKNYLIEVQRDIGYKKKIINNKKLTKSNFEYILASKSRIYEAEYLIDSAWKEYYNGNFISSTEYGSYGKLRGESAIWWLELKDGSNMGMGSIFNNSPLTTKESLEESQLKHLAQKYLDNSEIVVLYTSMVLPTMGITDEANNKLDRAEEYYSNGEYLLSIAESIDAYVYATTYLNYNTDPEYLKEMAKKKINTVEKYNYMPISALGYYEYANSFNDTFSKALYYKYSIAYAQMDIDILKELNTNSSKMADVDFAHETEGDGVNNLSLNNNGSNPTNSSYSIIVNFAYLILGLSCGVFLGYFLKGKN
ncbi:hypothetical protein KKP88_00720 [Methanothermococcus sp. SCGC AD-155-K20]|nr:hypothetical protein [Methanothermococcus sp. SCGC AD-155-K20]